ncbi:MAG: hypothetical protein Q4C96_01130, partial [Planctomycetia bacterium]|nr:hypothetical protein [Planctomycetia bacterium]
MKRKTSLVSMFLVTAFITGGATYSLADAPKDAPEPPPLSEKQVPPPPPADGERPEFKPGEHPTPPPMD